MHHCLDMSALTSVRPSSCAALGLPGNTKVPESYAWELIQRTNRAIHAAYFDDHYSILIPQLHLLAESSPYLNSWLALGAILSAQQLPQSPWAEVALRCHTQAVSGLCKHLLSSKLPDEWAVSTLVLLHIFERYGNTQSAPSDAHVKSIRTVFLQRYVNFPPSTVPQLLQLSSLIYRVAVINMFRPLSGNDLKEYHCLDQFVSIWASSQVSSGLWQHSLWIGLQPPVFNIVFKLSTLVRQAPLDASWLTELDRLENELNEYGSYNKPSYSTSSIDGAGGQRPLTSLTEQSYIAHCLYFCAFGILIAKLRALQYRRPNGRGQAVFRRGLQLLAKVNQANFPSMTLLWPAIIISLDAREPTDQCLARMFLTRLDHGGGGSRSIASVQKLFEAAWEIHGGTMLGTHVLFEPDIMAGVFL